MSMSLETHLAELLRTSSREQTARTLAVRAGVGVLTAKRALDGRPVRGANARLIASVLRELGIETSAGDLALGTEDAS